MFIKVKVFSILFSENIFFFDVFPLWVNLFFQFIYVKITNSESMTVNNFLSNTRVSETNQNRRKKRKRGSIYSLLFVINRKVVIYISSLIFVYGIKHHKFKTRHGVEFNDRRFQKHSCGWWGFILAGYLRVVYKPRAVFRGDLSKGS